MTTDNSTPPTTSQVTPEVAAELAAEVRTAVPSEAKFAATATTATHAALIDSFYRAFAQRDAEAMVACYDDAVVFSDPVFGALAGERARQMWRMLCARATDLRITHHDVVADATSGSARWDAHYTFSATGRPVHNVVHARFGFRGGKIVRHDDVFDLYRWARQALGAKGRLLGWASPVQRAIGAKARAGLDAFMGKAAG
jgi:ketosteroid isomerase-like protein